MAYCMPSSVACQGGGEICSRLLCFTSPWSARGTPIENARWVSNLSGSCDACSLNSSHIEVDEAHNGNLFFWHFQNRHIANRQRTVIWLNGGPGCSSMDGALMEIGPYRVKEDGTLEYSDGSWDEFANILFIDNPVGTGFSYVNTDSYVHELKDMAEQMVIFLKKFFSLFPEYEDNDVSPQIRDLITTSNTITALHCRRILRRAAYPVYRPSHTI